MNLGQALRLNDRYDDLNSSIFVDSFGVLS